MKEKFVDGEQRGIRWQPEAVVNEMKNSKDPITGNYVFELSELVKVGTVRSFFSRQSTSRDKKQDLQSTATQSISITTAEENDIEEDTDEQAFQEQLSIDLDLQLREIQLSAKKINTEETASATNITKRALSSLENENISHTRKSSRFLRKNNQ